MNNNSSLPYGWVKQTDPSSGHEFYVDTKANPPRSIWTHPYDDEMFLREHPDIRDETRRGNNPQHSFNDKEEATRGSGKPKKQGFFDKLKNKAADSMEKRNERHRQQLLMQQQQQERLYGAQGGYGAGGMGMMGMPPNRYPAPQNAYPAGYSMGGMGSGMGMGMGGRRGGMGGGGNMALPLMGGLAGGLLLGDILDNDNGGNGGDWGDGGGDFGGGGDFSGGGGF